VFSVSNANAKGNRKNKRKNLAGEEYIEDGEKKWRKGKDLGDNEFYTDDNGTKWYKTKDLSGTVRWKDYDSGRSVRVTEDLHGDKKYIED
jgi:hypothetical protein